MSIVDVGEKRDTLTAALRSRRRITLAPPSRLSLDEWSDEYRVLTKESSSMPGPWKTSNYEIGRGPMRAVTETTVSALTCMASAQIMKTSTLEALIGRYLHLEPCPMLIFEPTEDTAKGFDNIKLEPMIRATRPLRKLFGGREGLARQHPNFQQYSKSVPGGYIKVFTANSTANLGMRSVKIVMFDEVDKLIATRDGDVIKLGEERLKTFRPNALSVRVSTPTITGKSRIAAEYDKSDQRKPYVACPGCGEFDYLRWENVKIPKADDGQLVPGDSYYMSECCGYVWTEADRIKTMTTAGAITWRQTRTFICCGVKQDPEAERLWEHMDMQAHPTAVEYPTGYAVCKECGERAVDSSHAGFWAWEIYHPKTPITETAKSFVDSKDDRGSLQNFLNSQLARTFSEKVESIEEVDPQKIAARSEPQWSGIPEGVKYLTAGVDVQGDRLEVEVVGWGDGDESWSIEYQVLTGDPRLDDVWMMLDRIIREPYTGEDGRTQHYVQATCVDAGYLPATTCNFAAPRQSNRVWPIKSLSEAAGSRSPLWSSRSGKTKHGDTIYRLGSQAGKDMVHAHLGINAPGPGYMHVPNTREMRWYEQLTAEHLVRVSMGGGREGTMWQSKTAGRRNEAIDCRVYALAALHGLRARGIISRATAPGAAIPTRPQATSSSTPAPKPKRPRKKRQRSSFWD